MTSLRLYSLGFRHYSDKSSLQSFPPRPFTLFSRSSNIEGLSYWYRPHRSLTENPVLFLHGIGVCRSLPCIQDSIFPSRMLIRCFIDWITPIHCFSRGAGIATPRRRYRRPRIPLHQFSHHHPTTLAQRHRHRDPTNPRYPFPPTRCHHRTLLRHRYHRPTLPLPRHRTPHRSDALCGSDSFLTPPPRRGVQLCVPVASDRQRVVALVLCESGSRRVAHALAPFLLVGEYPLEGRSL